MKLNELTNYCFVYQEADFRQKNAINMLKYLQWNLAITKCHGTEKIVRYSGVFAITNYLVNYKNIRYSGVTKLNQAEQWDIHHAKQSINLRVNSYI